MLTINQAGAIISVLAGFNEGEEMEEKIITSIVATRACRASGTPLEAGKTYAVPDDVSAKDARFLVAIGKAADADGLAIPDGSPPPLPEGDDKIMAMAEIIADFPKFTGKGDKQFWSNNGLPLDKKLEEMMSARFGAKVKISKEERISALKMFTGEA